MTNPKNVYQYQEFLQAEKEKIELSFDIWSGFCEEIRAKISFIEFYQRLEFPYGEDSDSEEQVSETATQNTVVENPQIPPEQLCKECNLRKRAPDDYEYCVDCVLKKQAEAEPIKDRILEELKSDEELKHVTSETEAIAYIKEKYKSDSKTNRFIHVRELAKLAYANLKRDRRKSQIN